MSGNQIVETGTNLNQLQIIGEFGINELATMKETIGKDLTIPQFNLFMYQCNRMGLDPALKHAFPILYSGKLDSRVSYEGLLSLAKKSDGYQGVYNQVICDNETDDFEAVTDDEGVITKITHKIKFPRGKVVGAYSIAKRDGKKPFIVLMDVMEVQKMLKGQNQKFWKMEDGSPDPDMFKKHVGFRSIKGQYDIASVVEENMAEMNAAENVEGYGQRRDITNEVTEVGGIKQQQLEAVTTSVSDKVAEKWSEVGEAFKALGITEKKEQAAYIRNNLKIKGEQATLAEVTGLLKIIKLEIEEKATEEGLGDLD